MANPTLKKISGGFWVLLALIGGLMFILGFVTLLIGISTAEVEEAGNTIVYFSLLLIGGLAGMYRYAAQWVRSIPDERCKLTNDDKVLEGLVRDFRSRARLCRVGAISVFLLLGTITSAGFYSLIGGAWRRESYHAELPGMLVSVVNDFTRNNRTELLTDPEAVAFLRTVLDHGPEPTWSETIGPLLLLFFLLRITASIYRYMVRLASFYESRADYMQLGGKIEVLSSAKVLELVDASQTANAPGMKPVLESIRELAKRASGRRRNRTRRARSVTGARNGEPTA